MNFCDLTVLLSNFFMFTVNYRNIHTKSSHIIFTHSIHIYLANICCMPDTVPGISYRTDEAQRRKVMYLKEHGGE